MGYMSKEAFEAIYNALLTHRIDPTREEFRGIVVDFTNWAYDWGNFWDGTRKNFSKIDGETIEDYYQSSDWYYEVLDNVEKLKSKYPKSWKTLLDKSDDEPYEACLLPTGRVLVQLLNY